MSYQLKDANIKIVNEEVHRNFQHYFEPLMNLKWSMIEKKKQKQGKRKHFRINMSLAART